MAFIFIITMLYVFSTQQLLLMITSSYSPGSWTELYQHFLSVALDEDFFVPSKEMEQIPKETGRIRKVRVAAPKPRSRESSKQHRSRGPRGRVSASYNVRKRSPVSRQVVDVTFILVPCTSFLQLSLLAGSHFL